MSEMPEIQKSNSAKTGVPGSAGQPVSTMPVLSNKNEVMEQNVAKPTMSAPAPSVAPTVPATSVPSNAEDASKVSGGESEAVAGVKKSDSVEFTTQNIGAWKSKQEDPFAKQNQEIAEKKAKRAEARKKLQPYFKWGAIGLGAVAVIVAVIIVLVNVLKQPEYEGPEIGGASTEDVQKLASELQAIYANSSGYDQVDDAVDNLLQTDQGKRYETQVKLSQLNVYYFNGNIDGAADLLTQIDVTKLNTQQQLMYYDAAYMVTSARMDSDSADAYYQIILELTIKLSEERESEV